MSVYALAFKKSFISEAGVPSRATASTTHYLYIDLAAALLGETLPEYLRNREPLSSFSPTAEMSHRPILCFSYITATVFLT